MRKSKIFFSFLILLCFCFGTHAQDSVKPHENMLEYVNTQKGKAENFQKFQIFKPGTSSAKANYSSAVEDGVIIEFDKEGVNHLLESNSRGIQLEIPLKSIGQTVLLDLVEEKIFSDDFRARTSDGRDITSTMDRGKHFRGVIAGDSKSLVSLSVFKNEIIGFIANYEGNFVIGRLTDSATQHIIYNDADMLEKFYLNCDMPDDGASYTTEQITFQRSTRDVGDCVNIYVEAGQSVYNSFSDNLTNTTNFLNGVFAQSYVLYANEGITMQTSELFIWTTPDPYTGTTTEQQLTAFQNNTGAFNGDLGHLVEIQNIGGLAAGFDGICNADTDESLCFSGFSGNNFNNVPTYSFNVFIITHEMGHLLGSRHTHACVWNGNNTAIDGCSEFTEGACAVPGSPVGGGTIMSYCHNDPVGVNFNEGFHPQPSAVINNTVNAIGNCLIACAPGNDNCSNAISISYGDTVSGSTIGSTAGSAPFCGTSTQAGVWYTFTGQDAYARLSTCNQANFDTKISVYTGTCGGLICVAGLDDSTGCAGFTTELDFCTQDGEIYYVLVHGFGGATGNFDLTLNDLSAPPTAACATPFTVQLDANGEASITVADIDDGSSSECGIDTMTISQSDFTCADLGDNIITLTVTDVNGNSSTCTTIVTVEDVILPTVITQNITVFLDANGTVTVDPSEVDNGSFDNCSIADMYLDIDTFDCGDVGQHTVVLFVEDTSGNLEGAIAFITVEDNMPPIISCPGNILAETDEGMCTTEVSFAEPSFLDNCSTVTTINQIEGPSSGSPFPAGDTTVTFEVTDENGNTSVCSFTVTVEDNENPIAVTQDITVTLDGSGVAVIAPGDIDAGSTDNCGIDSMSLDIDTFTCDDVGENTVTLTVTDLSGNTHTATATVTVVDDEAPVIVCASPAPVITVIEDFDNGLPAGWSAVTNSGPCDWEVGELPWAGYGFGSNGMIFDDDACGLAAAPSNVTLTSDSYDTTGALALELKYDVAYRHLGSSSFTVEVFDGTDWQNVATYTTNTETTTESFDLLMYSNSDFQVRFTYDDGGGWNWGAGVDNFILEYEFVGGLVPQYFLDANGEVEIPISDLYTNVTDNCSVTVSAGGLTGGSGNEWTVNVQGTGFGDEVTWELRDNLGAVILTGGPYGLGYNDTQTVTTMNEPLEFYIETLGFWNDNTPSYTLSCSDEVVATAQMAGGAETTLSGLECPGGSGGSTGLVFTCEDIGIVDIVVTATDASGNVSSCVTQVEIVDAISPVASCMDFTLELGADGTATLLPEDIGGNSTDNCEITITAVDIDEFDCMDIGTPVLVTYFASDASGNISSCTAMVTVVDLLPPVITCPDDFYVDPEPNGTYTLEDFIASGQVSATDNCTDPVTGIIQSPAPGTLLGVGIHTISFTAEDEYGNEGICTFELTVNQILGDADLSFNSLSMYPNPAATTVYIGNPNLIDIDQISIYDLRGRLVVQQQYGTPQNTYSLDVSTLSSAVYMVTIQAENKQTVKRLVVK